MRSCVAPRRHWPCDARKTEVVSGRRVVLIVGASLAGVATAEHLRRLDPESRILLLGEETCLPYDRPPLSKAALVDLDFDWAGLALQTGDWFVEEDIELLTGRAISLDAEARTVTTDEGSAIEYDELVVATGSRARQLPGASPGDRVRYLRSLQDAVDLRERLVTPGHLIVVGAGFIGLEASASARSLGWEVTVLEAGDAPLRRVLPAALAEECWAGYAARGIALRTGAKVESATQLGDRVHVSLSDGTRHTGDLVLVCAGGQPNSEWVAPETTGVGVVCDAVGRSHLPHVSAVGDVACWLNLRTGETRRVEQWQAAKEHAVIVAGRLAGRESTGWSDPTYFWSDLINGRIQLLGSAPVDGEVFTVRVGTGKSVSVAGDSGRLVGIFTVRYPRGIARGRRLLEDASTFAEACAWAAAMAKTPALTG